MSTVKDILAIKGTRVFSVGPEATVLDTALLMNEHKNGGLVVMHGGEVVGIITERDILARVVVPRRDPAQTTVREVMTGEVLCCPHCLRKLRHPGRVPIHRVLFVPSLRYHFSQSLYL